MNRQLCWRLAAVLAAGAAPAITAQAGAAPAITAQAGVAPAITNRLTGKLRGAFRTARKPNNPYHLKRGAARHKIPHAPYHARFRQGAHHPLIRRYR